MNEAFEKWWAENGVKYSADALHMSEYHMAHFVWEAALRAAQEQAAAQLETCARCGATIKTDGA
jgi:hypothetical protein